MKIQISIIITTFVLLASVGTISGRAAGGPGGGGGESGGGSGGGRGGVGGGRGFGRSGVAKKTLAAGVVAGSAGALLAHAASKSKSSKTVNDEEPIIFIPGNGIDLPIYRHPEQVRSYYKSEGPSMSAFGIIALILGLIGTGSLAWFCYTVGLPMWKERNRRHSLILDEPVRRTHEGIPLQETPSTATPSP